MELIKRELTKEDKEWLRSIKAPAFISGGYGPDIVENKEENVSFVCLGGQGYMEENGELISEIPEAWLLIWNGHFIKIYTYKDKKAIIPNKKYEIIYSIQSIECEKSLDAENEQIIELVKEALSTYRDLASWLECAGVRFIFIKTPVFVENIF